MKLTEKKAYTTQRVLVYGPPKTGKSELVGKLSEHYNLIWFDIEKGWTTLLKLPTEWQERINIISIPDSKVFPIAAETWPKIVKGGPVSICAEHGKVSCGICIKGNALVDIVDMNKVGLRSIVVFDSLTQLTNSLLANITKATPDDYKPERDDWGQLKFLIDKFLSQIQAAGYNVVCITHEEEVQMEDGTNKLVPSSGSAKSSRNTAKYFDHVIYCEVKNKKHTFKSSTTSGLALVTGSRTGVDMEKNKEPSLLDIFTSWKDWDKEEHSENEKEENIQEPQSSESKGKESENADHGQDNSEKVSRELSSSLSRSNTMVPKTPGQIALDNMKLKAAELLKNQPK